LEGRRKLFGVKSSFGMHFVELSKIDSENFQFLLERSGNTVFKGLSFDQCRRFGH